MKQARLGRLDVARIGFGAMGMSAYYTGAREDDEQSIRTIHRAIDLGVTLIDTAEVYGPYLNEELVGRALTGRRDKVVLATKFGQLSHRGETDTQHIDLADLEKVRHLDSTPANIRLAVEGSLRRVGTDRIDLYSADRRPGRERASRSGALKLHRPRWPCPAVTPGENDAADRGCEARRAAYRQADSRIGQGDDPADRRAADRRRSLEGDLPERDHPSAHARLGAELDGGIADRDEGDACPAHEQQRGVGEAEEWCEGTDQDGRPEAHRSDDHRA